VKRFYLDVRVSNTVARKLYEKYGFVFQGMRKNYYSNPEEDAIVMSKVVT
jgi:ribosomal-protein-alanine N-acetyltransferase